MHHIVCFSGGMGSFAEAKSCCDEFGPENVTCLFCDTLIEDPDLYRFIEETIRFLRCEYVRLCYGLTPWELFSKENLIANQRLDLCSRKLKRELMNGKGQWIDKNFGYNKPTLDKNGNLTSIRHLDAHVHVGIDYSEGHRLTRIQERMHPWVYRSTLVEKELIIPKDYSEQFGIKRPYLYTLNFPHNNCGGFCVKAGLGQFKRLYELLPERYLWHETQEQALLLREEKPCKPFLRIRRNATIRYISMKDYRLEFIEQDKAKEDTWDLGGCGCALPL